MRVVFRRGDPDNRWHDRCIRTTLNDCGIEVERAIFHYGLREYWIDAAIPEALVLEAKRRLRWDGYELAEWCDLRVLLPTC